MESKQKERNNLVKAEISATENRETIEKNP